MLNIFTCARIYLNLTVLEIYAKNCCLTYVLFLVTVCMLFMIPIDDRRRRTQSGGSSSHGLRPGELKRKGDSTHLCLTERGKENYDKLSKSVLMVQMDIT